MGKYIGYANANCHFFNQTDSDTVFHKKEDIQRLHS